MQGQVGADLGMGPRGLLMYPGGGLGVFSVYPLFAAQPTRPSATEGEGQGTTQVPEVVLTPTGPSGGPGMRAGCLSPAPFLLKAPWTHEVLENIPSIAWEVQHMQSWAWVPLVHPAEALQGQTLRAGQLCPHQRLGGQRS